MRSVKVDVTNQGYVTTCYNYLWSLVTGLDRVPNFRVIYLTVLWTWYGGRDEINEVLLVLEGF